MENDFDLKRDALVNDLEGYGRIQTMIEHEWGTMRLDQYLLNLMSDTRDGQRHGFTPKVAETLMMLQLLNLEYLESKGIVTDEPDLDSRFSCSVQSWSLPKNF